MLFIKPGKSFKYYEEIVNIYKADGTAVASTLFSVTSPTTAVTATYVDPSTVTIEEDIGLAVGDGITLTIDDIEYQNRVAAMSKDGTKIKLSQIIPLALAAEGMELELAPSFYLIEIEETMPEDYYFLDNNESLLVSTRFLNISIPYKTLITRSKSLKSKIEEADIDELNKTALESVQADFSNVNQFWHYIDFGQLKELLIRKILSLQEYSDEVDKTAFREDYVTLKRDVIISIKKLQASDVVNTESLKKDSNEYISWNMSLGS